MKFAIDTQNFGSGGEPRHLAELAREAEEAGWDGFFLWDHNFWTVPENQPVSDTWISLAAIATATQRIKLGPMISPLARYNPWHLAREAVTLDRLSGGRLVFGVGLGGDWFGDYSRFGMPADDRTHAEMLEEGLEILTKAWSGEPFTFQGKHYQVKDSQFLPRPVQQPRIPVWVAGVWPGKKPFQRAARWDGVYPISKSEEVPLTPRDVRDMQAYMAEYRPSEEPYEVVVAGRTAGKEPEEIARLMSEYAQAGATWWLEGVDNSAEDVLKVIRNGPPRM